MSLNKNLNQNFKLNILSDQINTLENQENWKPNTDDFKRNNFQTFENKKKKNEINPINSNNIIKSNENIYNNTINQNLQDYLINKDELLKLNKKIEYMENNINILNDRIQNLNNQNLMDKEITNKLENRLKKNDVNIENIVKNLLLIKDLSYIENVDEKIKLFESQIRSIQGLIQRERLTGIDEINRLKIQLQDKIEIDKQNEIREKEKGKALFNELIRLNEQQEKISANLISGKSNNESRLQLIERKLLVFEKITADVNIISNSLKQDNALMFDKIFNRLINIEKETTNNTKNSVNSIENIKRIEEDLNKTIIITKETNSKLNFDINSKVDNRFNELNKLLNFERQERIRSFEKFILQQDSKLKIYDEQKKYDKEEINNKVNSIESLFKYEIKKKDDSIIEIYNEISKTSNSFESKVNSLKSEFINNQINNLNEIANKQMVTEKNIEYIKEIIEDKNNYFANIIQQEIQTRFESDKGIKEVAKTIIEMSSKELFELRNQIDNQNQIFSTEIRTIRDEGNNRNLLVTKFCESKLASLESILNTKETLLKDLFFNIFDEINKLCSKQSNILSYFMVYTKNQNVDLYEKINKIKTIIFDFSLNQTNKFNKNINNIYIHIKKFKNYFDQSLNIFLKDSNDKIKNLHNLHNTELEGLIRKNNIIFNSLVLFEKELNLKLKEYTEYKNLILNNNNNNISLLENKINDNFNLLKNESSKRLINEIKLKSIFLYKINNSYDIKLFQESISNIEKSITNKLFNLELLFDNLKNNNDIFISDIKNNNNELLNEWNNFKVDIKNIPKKISDFENLIFYFEENYNKLKNEIDINNNSNLNKTILIQSNLESNISNLNNLKKEISDYRLQALNFVEILEINNNKILMLDQIDAFNKLKTLDERYNNIISIFKNENNKFRKEIINIFKINSELINSNETKVNIIDNYENTNDNKFD